MVGLAQMVRASDCGPEGRRFDPDIPPHLQWVSKKRRTRACANGSIPISHPIITFAGIVQRLVCKFSKLEMRFRLSLPAPFFVSQKNSKKDSRCSNRLSLPAPDKKDNKSLLLLYFLSPVRESTKYLPAALS